MSEVIIKKYKCDRCYNIQDESLNSNFQLNFENHYHTNIEWKELCNACHEYLSVIWKQIYYIDRKIEKSTPPEPRYICNCGNDTFYMRSRRSIYPNVMCDKCKSTAWTQIFLKESNCT